MFPISSQIFDVLFGIAKPVHNNQIWFIKNFILVVTNLFYGNTT